MAPYYCFNPECERWGDEIPQEYQFVLAIFKWPPVDVIGWTDCPDCNHHSYWHDNWDKDERTHDDGSPVNGESS